MTPQYALVAYVRDPLGPFIESLRRDLHPALPHAAAHLTILPPRAIYGSEEQALELLESLCRDAEPFFVTLGEVETFFPTTPTVFVNVQQGTIDMCRLHQRLNTGILRSEERWPYQPHLTIAKMDSEKDAYRALAASRERWANYPHERLVFVSSLVFVREISGGCWEDVAPITLNSGAIQPLNTP